MNHFFQDSLMNRKSKRTAFIWNIHFCNMSLMFVLFNLMDPFLKKSILIS